MASFNRLRKRARRELEDLEVVLKRARKKKASPEVIEEAGQYSQMVRLALQDETRDAKALAYALDSLDAYVDENLSRYRPSSALETFKALLLAVLIAFAIRWVIIEPFRIPSGSMIPTLLVGDQLLVSKLAYGFDMFVPYLDLKKSLDEVEALKKKGAVRWRFKIKGHEVSVVAQKLLTWGHPKRGDVVVFRYPNDPSEDYIKRVIGLPGDTVELRDGVLSINGKAVIEKKVGPYDGPLDSGGCSDMELYSETLEGAKGEVVHPVLHCDDGFHGRDYYGYGPIKVPEDSIFVMGDNRDQSSDSRAWGFVPVSYLKGRALIIHLPLDPDKSYVVPRWNRFFKVIK